MNIDKNARLTPSRRKEIALAVVRCHLSKAQAARLYGVSAKVISRFLAAYH
jgi:predicted transcriptional regulator